MLREALALYVYLVYLVFKFVVGTLPISYSAICVSVDFSTKCYKKKAKSCWGHGLQ